MGLVSADALSSLLGIVVVNLVLSGDNAVVIGMAAHKLHGRQRMLAILFGGMAAVVLRLVFTLIAAMLMKVPALQLIGGLLLVWIAYRLLKQEVGGEETHRAAESLWQAMWIITVADVVMSLDNILAIAALARDNMAVLAFGLALSMALVLSAGGIVAILMERFPWVNYVGSIAIAYVAGEMIMKDLFVRGLAPAVIEMLAGAEVRLELALVPLLVSVLVPVYATWRNSRAAREKVGAVTPVSLGEPESQ